MEAERHSGEKRRGARESERDPIPPERIGIFAFGKIEKGRIKSGPS